MNFKNLQLSAFLVLCLIGAVGALTCFYTVQPDEEVVMLRFGKYVGTYPPGLHFKLPFGIDESIAVKTKLVLQQEFGFRTKSVRNKRTKYSQTNYQNESEMLTGDLNVAEVEWIVQFQISDPKKYLFHSKHPQENLRDVSESVMRRVVGDRTVTEILTVGRAEVASEVQKLMQEILDQYDIGIHVISIKLQDVNPPEAVRASFNEVNAAKQEQEKDINQAEREYNRVIPEAAGKAEKEIARARGYATSVVNKAKGDANNFEAVLKAYRTAPKVTRDRMYLETMEKLIERVEDITLLDPAVKGLLPVFGAKNLKGDK